MKKKILLIDDDLDMCMLLNRFLSRNGYEVTEAYSGEKGIEKFKQAAFDVVVCDYRLGDKDGYQVLQEINHINPDTIVLIITGYSDIKNAIDVIKAGAYDYITKPLVPDEILNVIDTATKDALHKKRGSEKVNKGAKALTDDNFVEGESKESKALYHQVDIVAGTDYSVILYGESGTGKEVIAQTIHNASRRKNKPFMAVDCGTLSKELSGSELFGHIRGAFTGAMSDKQGYFELADGGTLFLDEVANLSYEIQASLLRVIQERRFKRVGGTKEIPVDIRIIVASNENLQDAYKKGKFREDLYHRFNEFSINIPALRNRKEDISLFADFFLQKINKELGKSIQGFSEEAMQLLLYYAWPGNLREMRNVIRRAALLSNTHKIDITGLPNEIISAGSAQKKIKIDTAQPDKRHNTKNFTAQAESDSIIFGMERLNFNN
jgi:two-component system response regulator HydG